MTFDWDETKDHSNTEKHGLSFSEAQEAFYDPKRLIKEDKAHSQNERRLYCIGDTGYGIATVRFTMRGDIIRIIGAGYWRKERKEYEQKNRIR
jgi:uncharacterized DUF497 family protein